MAMKSMFRLIYQIGHRSGNLIDVVSNIHKQYIFL